ncbi:MAG TPA: T9SS type A sorting domain-containing protein [Bacteroidota bacterium]|nr:T9SS type A sorting domain-containing protein [Bacteroidota bacterium]
MQRKYIVSIFLAFVAASPLCAQTKLHSLNGPLGGTILSMTHSGYASIYAGTASNGIFHSTDGGAQWAPSGLRGYSIPALAIDIYGTILAATTPANMFRSTDGGTTWIEANSGIAGQISTSLLADGAGNVYASTLTSVFRSTDEGVIWSRSASGLPSDRFQGLTIDTRGNLYAATSRSGVYISTNSGSSWTAVNNGLPSFAIQSVFGTFEGAVYAAVGNIGIYKSIDQGADWAGVEYGNTYTGFAQYIGGALYAYDNLSDLVISTDFGSSWSAINTGTFRTNISSITFAYDTLLLAGTLGSGVYATSVFSIDWKKVAVPATTVTSLAFNADGALLAGTSDGFQSNGECSITSDGGLHWIESGLLQTTVQSILLYPTQDLFAATSNGVFQSTDNGATWDSTFNGLPQSAYTSLITNLNTDIIAGSVKHGVFLARHGQTGQWLGAGLDTLTINHLLLDSHGYVFAATNHGIYCSYNDSTLAWNFTDTTLAGLNINTIVEGRIGVLFAGGDSGIYRSDNSGLAWARILPDSLSGNDYTLLPTGHEILAGTSKGLLHSLDSGATWSAYDTIAGGAGIKSLLLDPDGFVYVGTAGFGVYKSNAIFTGVSPTQHPSLPVAFRLEQNYPNPFNPTTIIRYSLPMESMVHLEIVNLLGEKVADLINERESAGNKSVRFDASRLASGVYFYRLNAGTFASVRKLLLIR